LSQGDATPHALPEVAVTLGLWQDRPPREVVETARVADRLGFGELWIGEMATYDAFALATSVASVTERIALTVGPLSVHVRDPMTIAVGVASVADLTGRSVNVALGTSSPVVVSEWHGRGRERPLAALRESAIGVRSILAGDRSGLDGAILSSHGYRLRLAPPKSSLTVAAFGPGAIRVAAETADRMVMNLITPASAARLVAQLRAASADLGRPTPRVAVWATGALDPSPAALDQLRRGAVAYLGVPGYGEMFEEAGFTELVALARTRPHPSELLAATPQALIEAVGLIGDEQAILDRLAAYKAAGVDEVAVVPASTDDDPGGARTIAAVADAVT
jgi:probable F420-dependent oxidoreductase